MNKTDKWTTKQAAEAWGVSERRVRQLCAAGRVRGAILIGIENRGTWYVPKQAEKPCDVERRTA
jgi:DNA-binding transcriptional regulator LsrR (DeoR family)